MSDTIAPVKINRPIPSASPLPRPAEVKTDFECADGSRFSSPLNIAPPLTCHEISPVPAEFIELSSAQADYDHEEGLEAKDNRKQPLTEKEQKIVDRLIAARNKVVDLGVDLFKAALIAEQPSAAAGRLWQEYLAQVKKIDVFLVHTDVLQALADPKLGRADRSLLFNFVTGSRPLSPELVSRFRYHFRQQALEYNGWQGTNYTSEHTQFIKVLAEFQGNSFGRFQAGLIAREPLNYLTCLSRPEAKYYLRCSRSALRQKYVDLRSNLWAAPPGSQQRIELKRATDDLWTIALARGISMSDLSSLPSEGDEPSTLTAEETQTVNQINYSTRLAGGRSDSPYTQQFKAAFKEFAGKYLLAGESHKKSYAGVLTRFDDLSVKYGVRGAELDEILAEICRTKDCGLTGRDHLNSLQDLVALKSANVSPEGLPQEIKDILVKTGYWQLIKDNLNSIVFKADTAEYKWGGEAAPLLRRVVLIFDSKGELMDPWQIAAALVHEAAHVAWRSQPALLQNSTPDERQAYAVRLAFRNKYAELYGTPKAVKEAKAFLADRLQDEQAIRAANQILGYAPDNLSAAETALPSSELCRQRGLASADELDLSYYPAWPSPSFLAVQSDLDKFVNEFYPELDQATRGLLWEVLGGRADLIVSAKINEGSVAARPGLTLRRLAGKQELSSLQVDQLAEFFNRLPMIKHSKDTYHNLVFSAAKPGAGSAHRLSYGSLRAMLFQASLLAPVEAAYPDPAE